MVTATLGGRALPSDPDSVNLSFSMKTSDTKAVGGKVIQVYGVTLSNLTITGGFPDRMRKGRVSASWEEQLIFREWVDAVATRTETTPDPQTLRFRWPYKSFDLDVFIVNYQSPDSYDSTDDSADKVLHRWQLDLFIVTDRTKVVVKGIRDLYIKRLMDGVGWKRTDYNGPTEADLDALLKGRTIEQFLEDEANQAARGNLPTTGDITGFPDTIGADPNGPGNPGR